MPSKYMKNFAGLKDKRSNGEDKKIINKIIGKLQPTKKKKKKFVEFLIQPEIIDNGDTNDEQE